jgi:hypothetical protein
LMGGACALPSRKKQICWCVHLMMCVWGGLHAATIQQEMKLLVCTSDDVWGGGGGACSYHVDTGDSSPTWLRIKQVLPAATAQAELLARLLLILSHVGDIFTCC